MFEIITQSIKDLLFPKQCFSCKAWGNFICDPCRSLLQTSSHQRCLVCQKPSLDGWTHPKCKNSHRPDRLITIFDYHDPIISRLINTAKLSLVSEIFTELTEASISNIEIRSEALSRFVICPVPQLQGKARWRGFNQSVTIARVLSNSYDLVIDSVLRKSFSTKEQKSLNKLQRKNNLRKSFQIVQPEYTPSKILLVDDITTTGSTFLEAARTLKLGGVKTVWCFALAQD